MNKIQRVSIFCKWVFQILFFAFPIMSIIFWINAPSPIVSAQHAIVINGIPHAIKIFHTLSATTKLIGFAISLIPLTINLCVLYFLIRLFQLYAQCEIFSLKNVHYIKCIGYALFIEQLVHPIYEALLSAALTWGNPHGERTAIITFSGTNITILFTALLIILVSWIMAEGHKLKEDQQYTI